MTDVGSAVGGLVIAVGFGAIIMTIGLFYVGSQIGKLKDKENQK